MKINASINLAKFAAKCRRLPQDMDPTLKEAVKRDGRFFVREILKMTPPGSGGSLGAAKKQGMAKVARDIKRVFASLSYAYGTIPSPAAASAFWFMVKGRKGIRDWRAAERLLRDNSNNPMIKDAEIVAQTNPEWHQSARRRGVVPKVDVRGIVSSQTNLQAYIRSQQKRVGMLMGGWVAAARKLNVNVPSWVQKHASKGTILATSLRGKTKITITNRNKYATDANLDKRADFVLGMIKRSKAMERFIVADIRARMRAR